MKPILTSFLILLCASASLRETSAAEQPNIVFMLADDLGFADLGCYGHPQARTPNLDKLASEGTRFTGFYSTGTTCCPARTGLMTSRWPASYPTYPANGGFADRPTITSLLKQAGYRTGHFGKWHIGPVEEAGTYGIDVINAGHDDKTEKRKKDDSSTTGRDASIYSAAIRFIEDSKDSPFYVNIWGHISHSPVDPSQALVDRWSQLDVKEEAFSAPMREKFATVREAGGDVNDAMRRYLADVESLDSEVGRLLTRLDELGLRENTLVIFNSDQGADMTKAGLGGLRFNQMGYNGHHRGGKHTNLEGGLNTPFIVRWPGKVPAGKVDDDSLLSAADFLPTLCALTGTPPQLGDYVGEDASAAWLGHARHIRTQPMLWKTSAPNSESVIRSGPWKLFLSSPKKNGEVELFNVVEDPMESVNLAEKEPQITADLTEQLRTWVATLPTEYVKTKDKED